MRTLTILLLSCFLSFSACLEDCTGGRERLPSDGGLSRVVCAADEDCDQEMGEWCPTYRPETARFCTVEGE